MAESSSPRFISPKRKKRKLCVSTRCDKCVENRKSCIRDNPTMKCLSCEKSKCPCVTSHVPPFAGAKQYDSLKDNHLERLYFTSCKETECGLPILICSYHLIDNSDVIIIRHANELAKLYFADDDIVGNDLCDDKLSLTRNQITHLCKSVIRHKTLIKYNDICAKPCQRHDSYIMIEIDDNYSTMKKDILMKCPNFAKVLANEDKESKVLHQLYNVAVYDEEFSNY